MGHRAIGGKKCLWNKYRRRQRGLSKDTLKQGQGKCEDLKKPSWMELWRMIQLDETKPVVRSVFLYSNFYNILPWQTLKTQNTTRVDDQLPSVNLLRCQVRYQNILDPLPKPSTHCSQPHADNTENYPAHHRFNGLCHCSYCMAYMVNKIRLALSLWMYYYHKVQFMVLPHNPSTVDEHNVHINLCPQNKICISEFSGKLISQNVLTLAAVYCSLAGLKVRHCHIGYLAVNVYHCRAMCLCIAIAARVTNIHMAEIV